MLNRFKSILYTTGITEILFVVLVIILPFLPKVIPPVIIALVISAFAEKKISFTQSYSGIKNPLVILPILFLVYIIGLSFTTNLNFGLSTLERKLLFIVFPLFFIGFKPKDKPSFIRLISKSFILGIVLSAISCLIIANIYFWYEMYCREHRIILDDYPYTNYFFYSYLSRFMHYGYFSMFVNMAIVFQIWIFITDYEKTSIRKKTAQWVNIFFLSVFVLMLYAKAGTLSLILIFVFSIVYFLLRLKSKLIGAGLIIVFSIVIYVFIHYLPNTMERISNVKKALYSRELDKTSAESTEIRLLVWDCSLSLIQESLLIGYGTGDAQDELDKKYEKEGIVAAKEKSLNAHNEFLQSWLEIGITGPLLLLIYLFWFVVYAYRKNLLLVGTLYVVILIISFLTEATLRTQNGVLFTCLFGGFIYLMSTKDISDQERIS